MRRVTMAHVTREELWKELDAIDTEVATWPNLSKRDVTKAAVETHGKQKNLKQYVPQSDKKRFQKTVKGVMDKGFGVEAT